MPPAHVRWTWNSFCLSVLAFQNFLSVQPPYDKGQHIFKAKPTDVKLWYRERISSQVTMKLYGERYPTDIQRTINCYQNMILDMLFNDVKSSSLEILLSGRWVQSEEWQPQVLVEKTLGKTVRKWMLLKTHSPFWEGRGIQSTHRLFRKVFLASAVPPGHEDHSVCQLCDPPRPKYKVVVEWTKCEVKIFFLSKIYSCLHRDWNNISRTNNT